MDINQIQRPHAEQIYEAELAFLIANDEKHAQPIGICHRGQLLPI